LRGGYGSFCPLLTCGGLGFVALDSQAFIQATLRLLLALAQNSEFLIGFFGAASLLVWVELEIHALSLTGQARKNFKAISGFFLVSFAFYSIAAFANYAASYQQVGILYNNAWLLLLDAISFIFGFLTLGTGAWGLRHYGLTGARNVGIPSYMGVFTVSLGALLNLVVLVSILPLYSSLSQVTLVFLGLLFLTFPAAFLAIAGWDRRGRRLWFGACMMVMPWVFIFGVILLTVILNVIFHRSLVLGSSRLSLHELLQQCQVMFTAFNDGFQTHLPYVSGGT
jgi:hypothetical protein